MKQKLINFLKAGNAGLYVRSHEGQRVEGEVAAAAKAAGFDFYTWTATRGVVQIKPAKGNKPAEAIQHKPNPDLQPHYDALAHFMRFAKDGRASNSRGVMLLHDFHMFLKLEDPVFIRMVKDCLLDGKMSSHTMIIAGCVLALPPELEKEITVIDFKLPDREQLLAIAENIAKSANVVLNGNTEAILDASSGLTTLEAEDAMSLSIVETGDLTPAVISREKAETVKKNGILEIVETNITLEDIGGLEYLKADLFSKRHLFGKEAKEYGLESPRGILVVGQPGTGKTLTASATKTIFNLPLVRLEAGRIFDSLVGGSERNWRNVFSTVKAISPCILHVDEVDGLFAGSESSGKTDGGTTSRVVKNILQDMQFNGEGIFFVFTANDIDKLPDALIDRLDVWSVDLPNKEERIAIWSIHIAKRKRRPAKFDLDALAAASDGYSGRQIEQVWLKAMTIAFNDKGREPKESDAIEVLKATTPTSKLMAEQIQRRRERLANRAQQASKPEGVTVHTGARRIVQ